MARPLPPDNTATPSESYLARLCRGTFLRLWSYPALYRDKRVGAGGDGKELCDLLVAFGNDVLVFSDKACTLRAHKEPLVAWRRWYRSAVLDSVRQVNGAVRWVQEHPDRIFTDRRCSAPLPISISASAKFHRIVTCRGAARVSQELFGGSGSLLVTNQKLSDCLDDALHVGAIDDTGNVVHVFDEVVLDLVLRTLDTAGDFCAYLLEREAFLRRYESVRAAGEEELVGYYMQHYSGELGGHGFAIDCEGQVPNAVAIDSGFWTSWEESDARKSKLDADQVSYCWDELIDKFAYHILTETQQFAQHGPASRTEVALRWMARESRVRRRMLARTLLDGMAATPVGTIRRKVVLPSCTGDPVWVFLIMPRPADVPYELYRECRIQALDDLCCVTKIVRSASLDIVGLAVETNPEELSEDLLYLDARNWTNEQTARAARVQAESGILLNPNVTEGAEFEFPSDRERA